MRILILAIITLLITGCQATIPTHGVQPYVTDDGQQRFRFTASSKALIYQSPDVAPEELRMLLLSNRLGNIGYCQQGYDIIERKEFDTYIYYAGQCK